MNNEEEQNKVFVAAFMTTKALEVKIEHLEAKLKIAVDALENIDKRISFQNVPELMPSRMLLWLEHSKQDAAEALRKIKSK